MAQETFGYISPETEVYVAELFGMTPAHVHEVVTFYTLFFQRPVGRHVIAVCHNLSCTLRGAEGIVDYLEERLGVEAGETTPDGRITLLRVECLCACEAAPMMQVDDAYVGPLDRAAVDRALEGLR
jgi:NADH-quinone oxidoreductase subunit E